ncbi:hypothetical protein KIL84_000106 [Mauremys mutica]|uniref:Uncharacterized protein n=1 Tax=Mauremys mutica TaxID=74926 RepID=A0A9D3XGS5_9SAUR|nr:hypothetical protein KIL84_000106 [Mauremys mutica]
MGPCPGSLRPGPSAQPLRLWWPSLDRARKAPGRAPGVAAPGSCAPLTQECGEALPLSVTGLCTAPNWLQHKALSPTRAWQSPAAQRSPARQSQRAARPPACMLCGLEPCSAWAPAMGGGSSPAAA